MGAFGCARPLKDGSTARTSGSQKYTFGGAFGPKSRGGGVAVVTLGPFSWPSATPALSATAPAPRPARNRRRPTPVAGSCCSVSPRSNSSCLVVVVIPLLSSLLTLRLLTTAPNVDAGPARPT